MGVHQHGILKANLAAEHRPETNTEPPVWSAILPRETSQPLGGRLVTHEPFLHGPGRDLLSVELTFIPDTDVLLLPAVLLPASSFLDILNTLFTISH